METLAALGEWIAARESLISGLAALTALGGVVVSTVIFIGRRFRRPAARQDAAVTSPVATPRRLTLQEITAPCAETVRFADSGGLKIAFTERGEGEPPIVITPGIISHLHICSHIPSFEATYAALAENARLITFDKRGQGLSDPCNNAPGLSERSSDILAILDTAGIERCILTGVSEGGPMCIQFAHDHPDRVLGLILIGTAARFTQCPTYPIGIPGEMMDGLHKAWGTGQLRDYFFPSLSRDIVDDQTFAALEKLLAPRPSVKELVQLLKQVDVRPLLPGILVPSLVIHFSGEITVPVRLGRSLAEGLPNAEFLEVAGTDHADLTQAPEALAAIRTFYARVTS